MGVTQKMSVEVSEKFAVDISKAVASGDYSDANHVVEHALGAWKESREAEIMRLRRLWEEGIASGEPRPFTREALRDMIREGKERATHYLRS